MREPQTTSIGGKTYTVTPLPAMRALRLWPLVARGFMTDGTALIHLSADEIETLTRALLSMARVEVEGKVADLLPIVDLEDIPTLMQLLTFAVGVNYRHFSLGSVATGQPAGSSSEASTTSP